MRERLYSLLLQKERNSGYEMVKYFCNEPVKKIIDWNISFQTVSCIHLVNVDVYDCNRDCFKFCVKSKN